MTLEAEVNGPSLDQDPYLDQRRARRGKWFLSPLLAVLLVIADSAFAATTEFQVELPADLRRMAGRGEVSPVTHALVTIAMPEGHRAQDDRSVLVVSATSDAAHQSSRALLRAYEKAALDSGWIVVAADPEPAVAPADDHMALRLALNNAALAVLRNQWRKATNAPLAFGGFSGGAKYSGWLAAAFARQGRTVAGIYAAGSNEDTVAEAARHFGVLDAGFRRVGVFLQTGLGDAVATPDDQRRIAALLARAGFENVRVVTPPGGHEVDPRPLGEALEWFGKLEAGPLMRSQRRQ